MPSSVRDGEEAELALPAELRRVAAIGRRRE